MAQWKKMKSSLDKYQNLNRWEDQQSNQGPNVFANLFNKLSHYEHAYRQHAKNQELLMKYEETQQADREKSLYPQRMKSLTTEVSRPKVRNQSFTKPKILPQRYHLINADGKSSCNIRQNQNYSAMEKNQRKQQKKHGSLGAKNRKISTAKQNQTNVNNVKPSNEYQFYGNLNKSKISVNSKKQSQNISLNLKVNNIKFDRFASNYVKKRDRHKQIFGQKPKYVYKKIGGEEKISDIPFIRMR